MGNPRKLVSDLNHTAGAGKHSVTGRHGTSVPCSLAHTEVDSPQQELAFSITLRGLKLTVKFQYSYKKTVFSFSTSSLV